MGPAPPCDPLVLAQTVASASRSRRAAAAAGWLLPARGLDRVFLGNLHVGGGIPGGGPPSSRLDARDRVQAVILAYELGVVAPGS